MVRGYHDKPIGMAFVIVRNEAYSVIARSDSDVAISVVEIGKRTVFYDIISIYYNICYN
jgi:hypothetical protein